MTERNVRLIVLLVTKVQNQQLFSSEGLNYPVKFIRDVGD